MWKSTFLSPYGVAPSRMVDVSATVNLPLHHKVQKFSSGTGSPGWSWKKGRCGGGTYLDTFQLTVFPRIEAPGLY